jgi:hypothetical protein
MLAGRDDRTQELVERKKKPQAGMDKKPACWLASTYIRLP